MKLADPQYLFLMLHKIIGGAPLCYSLNLKGEMDVDRFEVALRMVVSAHPILRSCFQVSGDSFGDYQLTCLNEYPLPFIYKDVTGQDFSWQEVYHELLNRKTDLKQESLFVFQLFKVGVQEYHCFLGIDHTISDGLSSLQILHEIFAAYTGTALISQSEFAYELLVQQINAYEPSEDESQAYTKRMENLKKEIFFWNPQKRVCNSFIPDFRTICHKLDHTITDALIRVAQNAGVSFYSLLVYAYTEVFLSYEERVLFTLPTGGRIYPDVDATNVVGCFAQSLHLNFDRSIFSKNLEERLQSIHHTVHQAIEKGIDRVQTKKLAQSIQRDFKLRNGELSDFSKRLFRSSIKSNIYLSFTGHSPIRKEYGDLSITHYQEGTFNSAQVTDFMHTLFDGALYLFGNYDSLFFESVQIEQLMKKVIEVLLHLSKTRKIKPLSILRAKEYDSKILEELLVYLMLVYPKAREPHCFVDLEAELGFDSLSKIRLVTKIAKQFSCQTEREALFACRTLAHMAELISNRQLVGVNTSTVD